MKDAFEQGREESDGLSPAERELERALASLTPAEARPDRDALMFEAGRRSMRWRLRAWRTTSALAAGIAVAMVISRSTTVESEGRGVLVQGTKPTPDATQPARMETVLAIQVRPEVSSGTLWPTESYLGMRQQLVRRGDLPRDFGA